MIWALIRAVTPMRRTVTIIICLGLAWLLALFVETVISPTMYLVGVAATATVQTALLANAFYRVKAVRAYAQLPTRPRISLTMAVTSWFLLTIEVVAPLSLFRLHRYELTFQDVCSMILITGCATAGVFVTMAVASTADRTVALLTALGTAAWLGATLWTTWLFAAPLLAVLLTGLALLPRSGFLSTRGGAVHGHFITNYFLSAALADRVVWINGAGVLTMAVIFAPSVWIQGLHMPLAFALVALNTPLSTMVSGDPHLRTHLVMLGQPHVAWFHYAVAVLIFQGTANSVIAVVYWTLGAHDIIALSILIVLVTAFEVAAVVLLERRFPPRTMKTRRDAWRHPRKYLLPTVVLTGLCWFPLA